MVSRSEIGLCLLLVLGIGRCPASADERLAKEPFASEGTSTSFEGRQWQTRAPRSEMRPQFSVSATGESGRPALALETSGTPGLAGWWQTDIPIEGGKTYRASVLRHTEGIESPFRSAVARIDWLDARDRRVPSDREFVRGVLEGWHDAQQPDFLNEPPFAPADPAAPIPPSPATAPGQVWTRLSGTFTAPRGAVKARIELHLRWDDRGRVRYSDLLWEETEPPQPRKVKLATIHLRPSGGNPQANREAFERPVSEAALAGAQLIVLPETLTYYGTGRTPLEVSEPVPGPTTDYFGQLSKRLGCHIVATCFERDGHELFNTSVLLGPDGKIIGKYRKVCLPRGEIEAGITPGTEYPVFDTALGRIGMMICYDGFFPQVAQRLTDAGAEVIAWPVWGCNPLLARARAAENQVAIVSSTYESPDRNWMISAVYDPTGQILAQASEWGTFAMAELDLSRPPYWPSLGTHRSERFHHQPAPESR